MDFVIHLFHDGQLVTMDSKYNLKDTSVTKDKVNEYLEALIGKIFATLYIYEDCQKINDYNSLTSYLYRLRFEIEGFYKITDSIGFISIVSILSNLYEKSMDDANIISKDHVKSLIFHCISIIKKAKE